MYNELLTIENEIVTISSDDLDSSYHIGNWAIPPS